MGRLTEHNWDEIIADVRKGISRVAISRKYNLKKGVLGATISRHYPDLMALQHIPKDGNVKISPLKKLNLECPIMQKIEVINLHNKRKTHAEIAKELKISMAVVREIINKAKGVRNA
jgi:hypothetical protein